MMVLQIFHFSNFVLRPSYHQSKPPADDESSGWSQGKKKLQKLALQQKSGELAEEEQLQEEEQLVESPSRSPRVFENNIEINLAASQKAQAESTLREAVMEKLAPLETDGSGDDDDE